jgi:hypothetical protein
MQATTRSVLPLAAALVCCASPARAQIARSTPALPPSPITWTPVTAQPIAVSLAVNEAFLVSLEESCGFNAIARIVSGGRQVWRVRAIPGSYLQGAPSVCVPNYGGVSTSSDLPAEARLEASIALTSSQPALIYTFRPAGSMSVPAARGTAGAGVRQAVLGYNQAVMLREGRVLRRSANRLILTADGSPVMEWPAGSSVVILSPSGDVAVRQRLGTYVSKVDW